MNLKRLFIPGGIFLIYLFILTSMSWSIPPANLLDEYNNNKKTAQANPKDANAWFAYAMSCAYTGKLDEGMDALKKVDETDSLYAKRINPILKQKITHNPTEWKDRFYYAFASYAMTIDKKKYKMTAQESGEYQEESIRQFMEISKLLGDKNYITAWSWGYIAAIRGEQGKFQEAISLLRKAIKIEPDGLYLHLALGYAYLKTGNYLGLLGESLMVGRLKADEKASSQDEVENAP